MLRCGSVRFSKIVNATVRFGSVVRYSKSYGAVRCCDKPYGAVRCGSPLNGFRLGAGPIPVGNKPYKPAGSYGFRARYMLFYFLRKVNRATASLL